MFLRRRKEIESSKDRITHPMSGFEDGNGNLSWFGDDEEWSAASVGLYNYVLRLQVAGMRSEFQLFVETCPLMSKAKDTASSSASHRRHFCCQTIDLNVLISFITRFAQGYAW